MSDIFISYSSEDKSLVRQLAAMLEEKGWSVWWDRQIPIGQSFDTVIETELHAAKCVIVVWTKKSIQSQWVKNEAYEAVRKKNLVPIVLEELEIPLAFRHIESAMLIDWDGEEDHPELEILFHSIQNILQRDSGSATPVDVKIEDTYIKRKQQRRQIKIIGAIVGFILLLLSGFYFYEKTADKNLTVHVYDWKKNPITTGLVKIYLPEYTREQSIDQTGMSLFTNFPSKALKGKLKIEVSSSGYTTKTYDTLLLNSTALELTLPLTTEITISGSVKTAAEIPIKGVEVVVDGTKYYDLSKTNGDYKIHLEEYTLGDDITIIASHQNYEDKLFTLKIISPEMENVNIFLNPNKH